MRDACSITDLNGRLICGNDAFLALTGYERDELPDHRFMDLTPEKWSAFQAEIVEQEVRPGGCSELHEGEYRKKDGSSIPVEYYVMLMSDGGGKPAELWAVLREISDRKEARVELRHKSEQYKRLAENSPDVIIRYDRDYRHLYANTAAARLVGRRVEELVGHTLFQIGLPETVSARRKKRIDRVFGTGESLDADDTMPTGAGTRHLHYHLVPEFEQDGALSSVLVIGRDITERKTLEEELGHIQTELEVRVSERTALLVESLREQEAFSYSVSHDLRAPLRHINGYLAILAEDFAEELPRPAQNLLERTLEASRRMGKLIDDLLELAKIGRADLVKETVDLSGLAAEICTALQEGAPTRRVEASIADRLVTRGDRTLLRQMLENLFGNAWKYTQATEAPRVEFGMEEAGGGQVFYVRDNGVGFDMTYKDELFGAFRRLHGSEYEGSGIGLATVKRILDRHRGTAWAESRPDGGATFYFTLP